MRDEEGEPEAEQAREEIVSRTAADTGARAEALRKADGGTRLRAVQQLQGEHGNAYVQRMVQQVQRQPNTGVATPDRTQATGSDGGPAAQPATQDGGGSGGGSVAQLTKDEAEMVRKVNLNYRIAEGEDLFAQSEAQNRSNRWLGGGMSDADAEVLDQNLSAMRQTPGALTWEQRQALFEQFIDAFQKKAYDLTLYALDQAEKVARKEYTRYNPAADVDAYSREAAGMNGQGDAADFQMAPRNEQMDELKAAAADMAPIQASMVTRVRAEGRRQLERLVKEEESRSIISKLWSGPSWGKLLLAKHMVEISPEDVEDFIADSTKGVEKQFGKDSADVLSQIRDSDMGLLVNLKNVYGARFPILLARKTNFAELAAAPPDQILKHVAGRADQVLEDVSTARDKLSPEKIWSLPAVIDMTERMMGITPGFGAGKLIEIEQKNRATAGAFKKIALAVLQIGLSLIPGVGWAISLGIGAYNLSQDVAEHRLGSALYGASLDPARALAAEESGYGWLALDIVGMVADVGAAAGSFRALTRTMKGMEGLGDAAKGAQALSAAEQAFGSAEKIAAKLDEVEQVVRAQARVLQQEGKLAQGMTEEIFVQRVMSSLRRQVASKGAAAAHEAEVVAKVINRTHPQYEALLNADEKALTGLLMEHGEWKGLVRALENGGQDEIARNLWAYRKHLVEGLEDELGATQLGGASNEMISDIDLQITGAEAGEKLIRAEADMARRFGAGWSEMFRLNFYTEGSRLTRYQEVLKGLRPAEQAAMTGRMTAQAEQLNFARMMQHAADDPKAMARIEKMAQDVGVDVKKLEPLAKMDEASKIARRDELLRQIDRLEAEYHSSTGARRVELAEEISSAQMEANFFTHEANIGPGSLRSSGLRTLEKPEAYQSALTQLEMIEHIINRAGGDVTKAAREYELFKYVSRFGEVIENVKQDTAWLRYYRRQADAVYKAQRELLEDSAHIWLSPSRRAGITDLPQDVGGMAPVTDQFLQEHFDNFMKEASEVLPDLKPGVPPRTPHTAGGGGSGRGAGAAVRGADTGAAATHGADAAEVVLRPPQPFVDAWKESHAVKLLADGRLMRCSGECLELVEALMRQSERARSWLEPASQTRGAITDVIGQARSVEQRTRDLITKSPTGEALIAEAERAAPRGTAGGADVHGGSPTGQALVQEGMQAPGRGAPIVTDASKADALLEEAKQIAQRMSELEEKALREAQGRFEMWHERLARYAEQRPNVQNTFGQRLDALKARLAELDKVREDATVRSIVVEDMEAIANEMKALEGEMGVGGRRWYDPTSKHKPGGWGTPMDLDDVTAEELLNRGTPRPDGKQIYGLHEGRIYEFMPDNVGAYHGYPVPGNEVPTSVLRQWRDQKLITNAQYNRFIRGQP